MKKLILFIIIFTLFCITVYAGGNDENLPVIFSGNIDYLEGEVTLNNKPAELREKVKNGDIVKTGTDSYCEIIFDKKNIFRMGPDTIVKINWTDSILELNKGSLAAVFEKLDKVIGSNSTFKIVTPTATAGVRGTGFYIRVENELNTYICTCNGSLELYSKGSDNFISSSEHHKAFQFKKVGSDVLVESALMLYHSDSEMDTVAESIGVTIPWSYTSY